MNPVCSKCGKRVWWRATRGSRMADARSPCCQAPLKLPREQFVCFVCGRSRTADPEYVREPLCSPCRFWLLSSNRRRIDLTEGPLSYRTISVFGVAPPLTMDWYPGFDCPME